VRTGLLLKDETRNPTWSWKDRPNAVSAAVARHFGFARLAVISTGNHGAAAAAFSAANGLGCTVFCHPDAPRLLTDLMTVYGAVVARGGDQEARLEADLARGDTFPGTILCPRAGFTNPFGVEGFKTLAFEIVEQLGRAPDRVYVPVGSGDGLYGVCKGFRELHAAGVADRVPRVIACQAAGAAPLARAFHSGVISPVVPQTAALSIAEPLTGQHALRAVRESGGDVRTATDTDAVAAVRELARRGTAVELASAVAVAVALHDDGDGTAVVIGSGAAVKWPDSLRACAGH
jgi:threonine synthase